MAQNRRKAISITEYNSSAILRLLLIGILIAAFAGCQQDSGSAADEPTKEHAQHHDDSDRAHHHVAPHGGTLVAVGEHYANLEFLLDKNTGELNAWVFDGCAENPIRITDSVIECVLTIEDKPSTLVLSAQANELTGETVGNSSQFAATLDQLQGAQKFAISIPSLTIKGQTLEDISFSYPDNGGGEEHNEDESVHTDDDNDHGHDHDHGH